MCQTDEYSGPSGFTDKETISTKHLPFVPAVYWVHCVSQRIAHFLHGENPLLFDLRWNVISVKVHRLNRDRNVAQYWMALAAAQLIFPVCLLVVTAEAQVCTPSGSWQCHSLLEEKKSPVSSSLRRGAQIKASFLSFPPLPSALQSTAIVLSGYLLLSSAVPERTSRDDELEYKEQNPP